MKFVCYASGEEDHPWIPGTMFRANPNLEPLLRALEESGIETAEELTSRLNPSQSLRTRLERVRLELTMLQRDVEGLGHFLGAFHAINGLRQARTYVVDCLTRLPEDR